LREFDTFLPASCVHFGANAFTLWANAFTTTASAHRGRSCHKPTLRSRWANAFITILTQNFNKFFFEKGPQEKINRFETLKNCIIFWILFTVFSLSTKISEFQKCIWIWDHTILKMYRYTHEQKTSRPQKFHIFTTSVIWLFFENVVVKITREPP
jgi:hypothetical protein